MLQVGDIVLRVDDRLELVKSAGSLLDQLEQKVCLVLVGVERDGGVEGSVLVHLKGRR